MKFESICRGVRRVFGMRSAKLVDCLLARSADSDGWINWSVDEIRHQLGFRQRGLRSICNKLRWRGILESEFDSETDGVRFRLDQDRLETTLVEFRGQGRKRAGSER